MAETIEKLSGSNIGARPCETKHVVSIFKGGKKSRSQWLDLQPQTSSSFTLELRQNI